MGTNGIVCNGIEHITPKTLKGTRHIHSKCAKMPGDQEGIKKGRKVKEEGKKRNRERRNEARRVPSKNEQLGRRRRVERGWISDPEKEVICDT